MKRENSSIQLAIALILGCIAFRLLSDLFPSVIPNISPLMALAYIGAMYLPRRWGWLIAPVACVITGLAFITVDYRTVGSTFPWWTLLSVPVYLLASGLGVLVARHRSLGRILAGSVACSILFYLVANTFCWVASVVSHSAPGYPANLAGWWQANTTGLPGYVPTWTFLRNGMLGDLFFAVVLLFVFDRAILFGRAPIASPVRS